MSSALFSASAVDPFRPAAGAGGGGSPAQSEAFTLGASHRRSETSGRSSTDSYPSSPADLEAGHAGTDATADTARGAVTHADSRAAGEAQSERARGVEAISTVGGGAPMLADAKLRDAEGKKMVRAEWLGASGSTTTPLHAVRTLLLVRTPRTVNYVTSADRHHTETPAFDSHPPPPPFPLTRALLSYFSLICLTASLSLLPTLAFSCKCRCMR